MNFPEKVVKKLIEFLKYLPVKNDTYSSNAVQLAIAMLLNPSVFKKGNHIFLESSYKASEDGYSESRTMSIKIYQHKLVINRTYRDYSSYNGQVTNDHFRYIYPDDKYSLSDFDDVMDDLSELFVEDYFIDNSDFSGHCYCGSHFDVQTNVLKRKD